MVVVPKVCGELLTAIKNLCTLIDAAGAERFVAAPGLDLVVLGIFVTFPIIFGPKGLGTRGVGATIGAGMALFVFPSGGNGCQYES